MCAGARKAASGCTEATGRAGAPFDNAPMPSTRKTHIDALAISLLLACCMFWGFQQVLVKATVAEVAPVFQAFVRFALATVAVAPVVADGSDVVDELADEEDAQSLCSADGSDVSFRRTH